MLFFEAHEELTQHILEAYENEKWEKDEIYEKTKKIIKEYCADNILDTSDIEEPVEEIVRILNRNLDEYVRFFVEQYYQNVFRDQINPDVYKRQQIRCTLIKSGSGDTVRTRN